MQEILQQIQNFQTYPPLLEKSESFPFLGCHLSISNGFADMIQQMGQLKATGCAFFTSNVRGWNVKFPDLSKTNTFIEVCKTNKIGRNQFLPHAPYLINLASDSAETRKKSQDKIIYDAFLVRVLGLDVMNFHPGSCSDKEDGMKAIAQAINNVHALVPDVVLVLETMAGSREDTIIGSSFEELAKIISMVDNKDRVGVCIDTQHTFAGAFASEEKFGQELLQNFDKIVGQQYLRGFHVNGSLTAYGSGVDRHEELDSGFIKIDQIQKIIQQQRRVVYCLETPDGGQYEEEIGVMRGFWASGDVKDEVKEEGEAGEEKKKKGGRRGKK